MKILTIVGSEVNSNSNYIADHIINECQIKHPDVKIEKIVLSTVSMEFCTGCLTCDETGKCNIEDDVTNIVDKIDTYNGYIFISPVRWSLLSGNMKTFIDRLNPLATSRKLCEKKAVTIVIGQSNKGEIGEESIVCATKSIQFFCDNAEMDVISSVEIYNCLMPEDIKTMYDDLNSCIIATEKLISILKQ